MHALRMTPVVGLTAARKGVLLGGPATGLPTASLIAQLDIVEFGARRTGLAVSTPLSPVSAL